MKALLSKNILISLCFISLQGFGERLASLPGGLLFPVFSTSGLVNSASLVMDWRTEAKALYSPPTSADNPQSYLSSLGHSNGRLGFNVGCQGSSHENNSVSGGFAAAAFRVSNLALGVAARNIDLSNSSLWKADLSAIYTLGRYTRIGATLFGLDGDSQLGVGLGFGVPQKKTFAIDILAPVHPKGKKITDQYSATLSVTSFFEKMGFSGGIRFDRQQDGFSNPERLSGFVASTVSIGRSLNFTTLYQSNPATFTIGLAWVWSPSAKSRIQYLKEQNQKTLGRR